MQIAVWHMPLHKGGKSAAIESTQKVSGSQPLAVAVTIISRAVHEATSI